MSNNWKDIDGIRTFEEKQDKYYNLSTKRYVKNVPKGLFASDKPMIVGTKEMIEEFRKINKKEEIAISQEQNKKEEIVIPQKQQNRLKITKKLFCCFMRIRQEEEIIDIPKETIIDDKKKEVLKETISKETILNKIVSNVSNINTLGDFSLRGISGKCIVKRVLDGDTIDIIYILNLSDLEKDMEEIKNTANTSGIKINQKRMFINEKISGSGLIMSNCRCADFDAAEHNTVEGVIASDVLTDAINRNDGILFYDNLGLDKWGRQLIRFYFDETRTRSLSNFMISYRDISFGKEKIIAQSYNGGTKSEYMKNLKTYKVNEIPLKRQVELRVGNISLLY